MEPLSGSNPRVRLEQCKFTQNELIAGKVKIADFCENTSDMTPSKFNFTVCYKNKCTGADLCVPGVYTVRFLKKPIVTVPLPSKYTWVDGCLYADNGIRTQASGNEVSTVQCGEWAVAFGHIPPEAMEPLTVMFIPDSSKGPVTVLKLPNGDLALLPVNPKTQDQPPQPPGDFPPVNPVTGLPPAGNKMTGEDGTKWIKGTDGKWHPITESKPGGPDSKPNEDPIIRGTPHIQDFQSLADVPLTPNGTTKTFIKDLNRDVSLVGSGQGPAVYPQFFPEGDMSLAPFFWSGPNEFWFQYQQAPTIGIFGNLGFVKITPQGVDMVGEHYVRNPNSSNGGSIPYWSGLMGFPWNGYSGTSLGAGAPNEDGNFGSSWKGPEASSAFLIRFPGNRLLHFNRSYLNLQNDIVAGKTSAGTDIHERPNSYPTPYDYYSRLQPLLDASDSRPVGAPGGNQIPTWMWWHIYSSQTYGGSKGWRHARLTGVTSLNNVYYARPETVETNWPRGDMTFEVPLVATDLAGIFPPINRTFRLHWNSTGRSANGRMAEVTDNFGLSTAGSPGPVPTSVHCKFDPSKPGKEGDCYKA
jgi:hypothetical protein